MKFGYPWEKFAAARRSLMLPHPQGEPQSIADAFFECALGLRDLKNDDLSDDARQWVSTVQSLMDTSEIQDPTDRGTLVIKAELLTQTEKFEFSRAVDELAFWFGSKLEDSYREANV